MNDRRLTVMKKKVLNTGVGIV